MSEESTLQNFIQVSFYLLLTNWAGCVYVFTLKKKKRIRKNPAKMFVVVFMEGKMFF